MDEIKQLFTAGEHETAVKKLLKRIEQSPKDLENYLVLGSFLLTLQDFEQAAELYARALVLFPANEELVYAQGVLAFQQQDYPQAISLFEEGLNGSLKIDSAYMLASCYVNQQAPAKALAFALTAQEAQPERFDINLLTGNITFQLGLFAQALEYFKCCEQLDSTKVAPFVMAALTDFSLGHQADATEQLTKAHKIDPAYVERQAKLYQDLSKIIIKNQN